MNSFPPDFLWGAATAAHQVEGNNVNSDLWVLEHCKPTLFVEPSLDACDHYVRYPEDIRLLASLGLNTYRFSIEWARVEPEEGHFSWAALDHYRRMLETCHENGVAPMVTLFHFSSPRWFARSGGWERPGSIDLFARYCERVSRHMGDLISYASTFNEPNAPMMLRWIPRGRVPMLKLIRMRMAARRAMGGPFSCFFLGHAEKLETHMIAAHHRAFEVLKSGPGSYAIGLNIALQDEQEGCAGSNRDLKRAQVYHPWMDAASRSDFLGIQVYTRCRVGRKCDIPPDPGADLTQMDYEYCPEALEACLRYAASRVKVPIYITETGVATDDDARRVEYIRTTVDAVRACLADGIDVRGYIQWSLLDNFEWIWGYGPKFGLVAVDRATQQRTVKPSAYFLGDIARQYAQCSRAG